MLAYKQGLVTILGLTLALAACNQKKGNSVMDAPAPFASDPIRKQLEIPIDDRSATAWDEAGYQAFKADARRADDFFAKYSGRYGESNPKVKGRLEIHPGRIALRALSNRHFPKQRFCDIRVDAAIEAITADDYGYVVWFRADKPTRDCIRARVEPTDLKWSDGRLGLSLDYYNAKTLRLSLRDGYIFFLREG